MFISVFSDSPTPIGIAKTTKYATIDRRQITAVIVLFRFARTGSTGCAPLFAGFFIRELPFCPVGPDYML